MQRWLNTFKKGNQNLATPTENEIKNKQACIIMQLVLEAIATADFTIKTTANGEFHPPSAHLQLTDYISHGSRVIFDMSNLSEEHKAQYNICLRQEHVKVG